MNLLVVDDEYYIVQGIISSIRCDVLGIDSIFAAYSCEQARQIIAKKQVDILITDIEMSRENGLSLINWIQEQHYTIVTLILSGHQRFDYAQEAIKMHCFSYILKPVNPAALEKELLAQNAEHKDWACTEELMATTKDGKALYMHCLPADISGVSCEEGEVDASVFDRYRDPLYKEASFKPYIIAAMIFLAKFENPQEILKKLEERGMSRIFE